MLTPEQIDTATEFHFGQCSRHIGERGGVRETTERWRRSGKTQRWKTRPDDFRIPIKFGLRSYSEITPYNIASFHVPADCCLADPNYATTDKRKKSA